MSPLTNFFLNVFLDTLEKNRNIIVTIPDNILRPIPIISGLYGIFSKKSVLILTQKGGNYSKENILKAHKQNYYLLNYGDEYHGGYLFSDMPLGIIPNNNMDAKPYLPLASREKVRNYTNLYRENFLKSDKAKIFLDYDEKPDKITATIKNLTDDSKINLGLVIFENVDRFINSENSSKNFFECIKPLLEKKIQLIFHFSNTESKYIDVLKKEAKSLVLPWKPAILAHEPIKEKSINYFNKMGENREKREEMGLIEKYNIDTRLHYDKITDIEILKPLLDSGNIDYHYNYCGILKKDVKEDLLTDNILYAIILSGFNDLRNIFINPPKYKLYYHFKDIKGRYNLHDLIKIFRAQNKNKENELIINYLTSEIYAVYNELSDCKRYGEEISFDRIGKNYRILDIISNDDLFNNEKVIIATNSSVERNRLQEEVDLISNFNFKIKTIKTISKIAFDRSKFILVLPGSLRLKYFSELLRPYKKIYFLAYNGNNYNTIKENIKLAQDYSLKNEKVSISYFKEVYDFMGESYDSLIRNYDSKSDKETLTQEKSVNKINATIKDIINSSSKYPLINKYEEEMNELENKIKYFQDKRAKELYKDIKGIEIVLKRFNKSEIITKKLPLDKTFLYLKKIDGDFDEDTPDKLYAGCYVVILDNNERKSLLELVIDISGMEENVDTNLIETWKIKLNDFKKEHKLSIEQFQKYLEEHGIKKDKQTVDNWVKGIVLGPKYHQDILKIGKAINDIQLITDWKIMEQEIAKVRQNHINLGRKLRKIIKEILNENLDISKLSDQEIELYESIEDGIYEVQEVINGD